MCCDTNDTLPYIYCRSESLIDRTGYYDKYEHYFDGQFQGKEYRRADEDYIDLYDPWWRKTSIVKERV